LNVFTVNVGQAAQAGSEARLKMVDELELPSTTWMGQLPLGVIFDPVVKVTHVVSQVGQFAAGGWQKAGIMHAVQF
jgi:hypothetical protein